MSSIRVMVQMSNGHVDNGVAKADEVHYVSNLNQPMKIRFMETFGKLREMKKMRVPYESQAGTLICPMEPGFIAKRPLGKPLVAKWLKELAEIPVGQSLV